LQWVQLASADLVFLLDVPALCAAHAVTLTLTLTLTPTPTPTLTPTLTLNPTLTLTVTLALAPAPAPALALTLTRCAAHADALQGTLGKLLAAPHVLKVDLLLYIIERIEA
jgi:hypothetical protein